MKVKNKMHGFPFACFFILASLNSGCLDQSTSGSVGDTSFVTQPSYSLTPPERTICDPFNTGSKTARDRGLVATLAWLDHTMPPGNGSAPLQSASDYFDIGHVLPSLIYLDRIFVPTRPFNLAEFSNQNGVSVTTDAEDPNYQYFAIKVKGQFQLASNEKAGAYQVALLSDDGASLRVVTAEGEQSIVADNDKSKSTRLTCSIRSLHLAQGQSLPFALEYYHGPKYNMNAVLMWRPLPEGANPDAPTTDPMCGQAGQGRFFEPGAVPAVPRKAFYEMLSRGWKVLENENFKFPEQATNPCAPAELPLEITGFQVTGVSRTSITLNWQTNFAADSQIEVVNVGNGAVARTSVDNNLVTDHTYIVTELAPNTLYAFKAISKSQSGQEASTDPRVLRTLR